MWNRMRAMGPETFRVVSQPSSRAGLQILALKGAFTSGASGLFVEAVAAADAPRLILDLSELAMVGLNHRVHNVLHLTGIAPLFDTYDSVSEAEVGLG